ncbi:MAG: HAMP domain-containing histidine kinase [Actinobacteria bacterium]|nr:HAMP domain-containing histidine kinase [Actinomycetota bacterium]
MERLRTITSVAAVAVLAAALAVAAVFLVARQTEGVSAPRVDERVRYVEAAASDLADWIEGFRASAEAAAGSLDGVSGPGVDDRLTAAVAADPVLDGAYVVDGSGRVVAATSGEAALVGLPRAEVAVVGGALRGVVVVSGVVQDALVREPVVQVGVPVGEGPAGALIGTARLEEGAGLLGELAELPVPDGARLALVGPDGTVLRPGAGLETVPQAGPNLRRPVALAADGPGWVEYVGEAEVEAFAAYAPVAAGWSLVVHQDAASFSPVAEGYRAAAAAVPAVAALAILVVGMFVVQGARIRRARREADEAKRAFLAVTGHELRTPLTVMNGMLQTLVAKGEGIPAETRQEALRTVARHTRHLERLIERIIFAGHLEAGISSSLSTRPVDLAPALERAAADTAARAPTHDVETDIERPLRAEADRRSVEQAVGHLLDNAVRYSPGGGVVRLVAHRRNRKVVIAVEDEGVGLPADTSRIFGRFVQGEDVDTRVRDEGGVGLGLYIVRHLVEAMDGTVRAEPGEVGARFVIELTAAD